MEETTPGVDGRCRSRLSLTYDEVSEERGEVEQATLTRALRLRGDIAARAIDDLDVKKCGGGLNEVLGRLALTAL